MIIQNIKKWQEVPTITSLDEFLKPVSDIPFPAVTICIDTKNDMLKFDWSKKLSELQQDPESVSDYEYIISIM